MHVPASLFTEKGHFIGKTGDHLDARLVKDTLFNDLAVFNYTIEYLVKLTAFHKPTVLAAEQSSGTRLADAISLQTNIPVITLAKDGLLEEPPLYDSTRTLIVEDNIITGASTLRLHAALKQLNTSPIGAISAFCSGKIPDSITKLMPVDIVFLLDIQSWSQDICPYCKGKTNDQRY